MVQVFLAALLWVLFIAWFIWAMQPKTDHFIG